MQVLISAGSSATQMVQGNLHDSAVGKYMYHMRISVQCPPMHQLVMTDDESESSVSTLVVMYVQGSSGGVVRVKFQVDVEHLQLSFQAEPGGRAFLLAAERSQIVTCGINAEVRPV